MDKLQKEEILKQAASLFTAKEYDKALFLYSQVLSLNPTNIEFKLYCMMCDIASENEEKAQSMFDYFTVAKDANFDEAVKYIEEIINAHDGDNEKMMTLLKDISLSNVESLNAIEYNDFMKLVESRGSFKEAYQDIMFSTKVAITSKTDLIDFINKLIDNNFNSTAYNYLDGFNEFFSFDQDFGKLYEKLGASEIENNAK
ncbi:MAG: tetratricopeptide repeat protein [Campylobacterota bacterium]|nr:tetratricopeptide repeat protein [Campylobacterota bacterium]